MRGENRVIFPDMTMLHMLGVEEGMEGVDLGKELDEGGCSGQGIGLWEQTQGTGFGGAGLTSDVSLQTNSSLCLLFLVEAWLGRSLAERW